MSITTHENWYQISAKKYPGGIIAGTDEKYGRSNYAQFYMLEREKGLGQSWNIFFPELLVNNDIDLQNKKVVVIGVNDGQEYRCISNLPKRIIGIDLAHTALVNGSKTNEQIVFVQASAESLPLAEKEFDNAFCLRTYQVLNPKQQDLLLEEFKRTVRGKVTISLPAGYFDIEKDIVVKGNLVSGTNGELIIDEDKPNRDTQALINKLKSMGFKNITMMKTDIEIFVFSEINN